MNPERRRHIEQWLSKDVEGWSSSTRTAVQMAKECLSELKYQEGLKESWMKEADRLQNALGDLRKANELRKRAADVSEEVIGEYRAEETRLVEENRRLRRAVNAAIAHMANGDDRGAVCALAMVDHRLFDRMKFDGE